MAGESIKILEQSGSGYTEDDWGINENLLGFIATTSVSVTNTKDVNEAKNNKGETVAVVVTNEKAEVTIEGIGQPGSGEDGGGGEDVGEFGVKVGALKEIDGISGKISGDNNKMVITESTVNMSNEDWVKYSIKGTVYELVDSEGGDAG